MVIIRPLTAVYGRVENPKVALAPRWWRTDVKDPLSRIDSLILPRLAQATFCFNLRAIGM